jgi:asparagine synthase (glutamine-hydrolysing)
MCGISGFNWQDEKLGLVMNECLKHRGPDAEGTFTEEGVTLAHRRLAIIDLSPEANQPMRDEVHKNVIVFNGEIYNYQTLRRELEGRYDFKTQSDTEVILAGYQVWGQEVVKRLNGIFAFAIWDASEKKLFLARDHMGVKPLYYSWQDRKLIFASEIKALLAHPISRQVDREAFNAYLRVLYVPEPQTMFKAIRKLPPGHTLTLQNSECLIERYYQPVLHIQNHSFAHHRHQVQETVERAVARQLISDVPVGIYLSGGIDSSTVLASVKKVQKRVETFSVGFDVEAGEDERKFNRDFHLARETAAHFSTTHHELRLSAADVATTLEEVIGSLDDPISNPTAIAMAHLATFAKKHVTVVLAGDGGDELFGGYERYRTSRIADLLARTGLLKFFPAKVREVALASTLTRVTQFEFEKDKRLAKVVPGRYLEPMAEVAERFKRYTLQSQDKTAAFMLADIMSWLPDQALTLGDKMSMRGSVEVRVPLLDREVVDLALTIPIYHKVTPFTTKKVLKEAFRQMLPAQLFREPKRGWFSPGAKWLRRPEMQGVVRRILSPEYYEPTRDLFNWTEVHQMLEEHIEKREYNLTILWMIMTFQIWAKKYQATV